MPIRERRGKWHYRFAVDGQQYTGNTGLVATERNRNVAMRAEAKARELVLAGRAQELRVEARTFNDACTRFLEWAGGHYAEHPSSARRLGTSFASLREWFGPRMVGSIRVGDIDDYAAWRRKQGVKPVTLRHDLHALSKGFQYWIKHAWARTNPVREVEIPSDRDAVRMHVLTEDEERRYFAEARGALYDVARLILLQGMRPSEVLNIRWGDIDFGYLRIRYGKSHASRRTLALVPESRDILGRKFVDSGWAFPSPRNPSSPLTKLNNPHNRVLAKTGLDFVLYDLRHTFATRAAAAGMPVATLAAILGHGDLRSVGKYVHIQQAEMDSAMHKFAGGADRGSGRFDPGAAGSVSALPDHPASKDKERVQ